MNIDDKTRVLKLLADRSQDAVGLCSGLRLSPNMLFTLLRKMEKEGLIVWNGEEWAVRPSSDSKQSDLPDTSHPSEGVQMPQCDGCHKDVKRITKYSKTGQWLCETCVTDLEKPPPKGPPTQSAELKDKTGVESAES